MNQTDQPYLNTYETKGAGRGNRMHHLFSFDKDWAASNRAVVSLVSPSYSLQHYLVTNSCFCFIYPNNAAIAILAQHPELSC